MAWLLQSGASVQRSINTNVNVPRQMDWLPGGLESGRHACYQEAPGNKPDMRIMSAPDENVPLALRP